MQSNIQPQTKVIHHIETKNRRYEICGPIYRLPNGNRYLTVNIIKNNTLIKRLIVEDDGTQPVPWGTGLGNAPQDLWESLDIIFCNYD